MNAVLAGEPTRRVVVAVGGELTLVAGTFPAEAVAFDAGDALVVEADAGQAQLRVELVVDLLPVGQR